MRFQEGGCRSGRRRGRRRRAEGAAGGGRRKQAGGAQGAARRDDAEGPVDGDEAEEVEVGKMVGDNDVGHGVGGLEAADGGDVVVAGDVELRGRESVRGDGREGER